MNIEVKSQVIMSGGKVKYWKPSATGLRHYHLGVWIESDDVTLDKIDRVEYLLHETFKRPLRSSENRANGFGINFWTWGMFLIPISIYFKDGTKQTQRYYLSYTWPKNSEGFVEVES